MLLRTIVLTTILIIVAPVVRSEPGPIGQWLMNEPLTLFDWGIYRINKEIQKTVNVVNRDFFKYDLEKSPNDSPVYGGVYYDWDNNEINIYLRIRDDKSKHSVYVPTHDNCVFVREWLLYRLTPTPSNAFETDLDNDKFWIHFRVNNWFSNYGFSSKDRPENLGEKLARIIWVEVNLSDGKNSISCRERITELDAHSKPN